MINSGKPENAKSAYLLNCDVYCTLNNKDKIDLHTEMVIDEESEICPTCFLVVKKVDMDIHKEKCNETMYSCTLCGNRIKGGNFKAHLLDEHN